MHRIVNCIILRHKIFLLSLVSYCYQSVSGQSLYKISLTEGLSNSTVLSICKDENDFMWFGTRDGLNRYDGKYVKNYYHSDKNQKTISESDYIFSMLCDYKGSLWVGTKNGLNKYYVKKDSFEHYYHSADPNSLSDNTILCMLQDREKNIWFGTSKGLNLLRPFQNKFTHFLIPQASELNNNNQINVLYEDKRGDIWVGTSNGLKKIYKSKGEWHTAVYNAPSGIQDNSIKSITEDCAGNLWIATVSGNLYRYDYGQNHFSLFQLPLHFDTSVKDNIRKIFTDDKGLLWIATIKGMEVYDPIKQQYTLENVSELLNNISIKDIYQDKQGTYWIGTMYDGVYSLNFSSLTFNYYRHSNNANSLSGNIISALLPLKDGMWIGTEGFGLNYLDYKTGSFTHYKHDAANPLSISTDFIKSVAKDNEGNIWIGTYLGGINKYNASTGEFVRYRHENANRFSIPSDYVMVLYKDMNNILWAGTSHGLAVFHPESDKFETINSKEKFGAEIINPIVTALCQDNHSNFWIGTVGGLNMYSSSTKKIYSFFSLFKYAKNIEYSYINCLYNDREGNMWIGTFRNGLFNYDLNNNSIQQYTIAQGLPSNNIKSIQENASGSLWISTDHGIAHFNVNADHFVRYDIGDGLPSTEYNDRSGATDNKGNIYFGSYNGLVHFSIPDSINTIPPKIFFTDVKLFNKSIIPDAENSILKTNPITAKELTFRYDQNVFTIDFAALNYIHPERNKYAYKLEGFDKKWNYSNLPQATYMNLPAGKYKLLIKGSNNDEVWSKTAFINIFVLPPWWRTWWAYCLYFIVSFGIVRYAIILFKKQIHLKNNLFLKEADNAKNEEQFKKKLDFFTHISHEIRTPLTLMTAPIEKILERSEENSFTYRNVSLVRSNAEKLLGLVNELLDFRKFEDGKVALNIHIVDFEKFCKSVFLSFETLADANNLDFRFCSELSKPHFVQIDSVQMEKVLSNLYSNAIKYTKKGQWIKVILREDVCNNKVLFHICDSGAGVSAEESEHIFEEFYQAGNNFSQRKGWGIGLSLAKKIIELHHGDIYIEKQPEKIYAETVTCFTFSLPIVSDIETDIDLKNMYDFRVTKDNSEKSSMIEDASRPKRLPSVLIIEDNMELLNFIKETLSEKYNIYTANNGDEGLAAARQNFPDIIISDIAMPGKNGIVVCSELKNDISTSHIPVILLTAQTTIQNQVDGLSALANAYITKPFSMKVLELTIQNMLLQIKALQSKYKREIQLIPERNPVEKQKDKLSKDEEFILSVKNIIIENLEDADFNVGVLVQKTGVSRTVLFKKIKAMTDININEFMKSVRLNFAAQLLLNNNKELNISEIAYKTGFSDPKYFSKEFKKQFNLSPTDYIKEFINK